MTDDRPRNVIADRVQRAIIPLTRRRFVSFIQLPGLLWTLLLNGALRPRSCRHALPTTTGNGRLDVLLAETTRQT